MRVGRCGTIDENRAGSWGTGMRTLIYKRTHNGDPDAEGRFGIHDCMGQVRRYGYEAVIGVGGVGDEPEESGIAGKVNWIGIGPHKAEVGKRGPLVTFDHFLQYGADAPEFLALAPKLASRMYENNVRLVMNKVDDEERKEIAAILARAKNAPPSCGGQRNPEPPPDCPPGAPRVGAREPPVRKGGGGCRPASARPVRGCSR
jgi:hypothetical protein